jgi:hypothetical protein
MRIHEKEQSMSVDDGTGSPVTFNRTPRGSKKRPVVDDDSKRKPDASHHPAAKRIVFDKDVITSTGIQHVSDVIAAALT